MSFGEGDLHEQVEELRQLVYDLVLRIQTFENIADVDAKDGYVWVKVKDTPQAQVPGSFNDNFRLLHHVVWERANGRPVPPHTMIVFADRDKRNFDPGNLVAVPRDLWTFISLRSIKYYDAESLRTAMAVARLDRARCEAQRRRKEAKA